MSSFYTIKKNCGYVKQSEASWSSIKSSKLVIFFSMIFALALVLMSRAKTSLSLSQFFLVYTPFTDRCRLEQPTFLEQIQDNLVRMLYYLLEDHHGDEFMVAFSRIISMLTGLRSLTENYFRQFKTICKDDLIKQEMPELLGFLFDE